MVTAKTKKGLWIAASYEDEYIREKGEWKIKKTKGLHMFCSDIEKGWAKERFTPLPKH